MSKLRKTKGFPFLKIPFLYDGGDNSLSLLIIGPEKRRSTEIAMVEAAKKYFDKVLYASVTRIRIESGSEGVAPFFRNTNLLKFDVVLVRIPSEHRDFGYVLTKIFEDSHKYLPVGYKAIVISSSEFLLPVFLNLKNCALKSPLTYFASSKEGVVQSLEKFSYPVSIRPPYEKNGVINVDSKESALGIVDTMEKLNQSILIQESLSGADSVDILVSGSHIYALKNKEPFALKERDRRAVLEVSRVIGAEICRMNGVFHKGKLLVRGISPTPRIMIFEEKFGGNIIDTMFSDLREKSEDFFERNPLWKILRMMRF